MGLRTHKKTQSVKPVYYSQMTVEILPCADESISDVSCAKELALRADAL